MSSRVARGVVALCFVVLLVAGAFLGLGLEAWKNPAGAAQAFDFYLARIARFTLWQAALSTLLSVAPALVVARALSRNPRFPGRGLILKLFALPLALPAIVAALGILSLLGRAGFLAPFLSQLSGEAWGGIYGLSGILVAHVFFNMPLAARLFVEALETVPADQWRLASQLGMGPWGRFRLIEWPALRASLPGVAGLVFMLCITSFTIVLVLGGGPAATTVEVAIYQALRFDFDPARAVALTLVQIAMTVAMVALLGRMGANATAEANLSVSRRVVDDAGHAARVFDGAVIIAALLFVAGPMVSVLLSGLGADLARLAGEAIVWRATLTSIALAALSACLACALAAALVMARRALEAGRPRDARTSTLERLLDSGAGFVLVVPPVVIGAGWFILLRNGIDVFAIAPFMVVAVNAVMAMPFAVRALRPAHDAAAERHDRLCEQLGLAGLNRWRLIDWPVLRRPLATAFAFAMALSLGDLGVIALFGSDAVQTLPYLLLSRMASYRTADAAGLALMLGVLCLALMMVSDRLAPRAEVSDAG